MNGGRTIAEGVVEDTPGGSSYRRRRRNGAPVDARQHGGCLAHLLRGWPLALLRFQARGRHRICRIPDQGGGNGAGESADGRYLCFGRSGRDGSGGLWRMPAGGGEEARIPDSLLGLSFDVTGNGVYRSTMIAAEATQPRTATISRATNAKFTCLSSICPARARSLSHRSREAGCPMPRDGASVPDLSGSLKSTTGSILSVLLPRSMPTRGIFAVQGFP